jgi:hypothetical protein
MAAKRPIKNTKPKQISKINGMGEILDLNMAIIKRNAMRNSNRNPPINANCLSSGLNGPNAS